MTPIQPSKNEIVDVSCPISRGIMSKVSVLACDHFFETNFIVKYFKDRFKKPCPFCKQVTFIVPSDQELEKCEQRALKRSQKQMQCDSFLKAHPELKEPEKNLNLDFETDDESEIDELVRERLQGEKCGMFLGWGMLTIVISVFAGGMIGYYARAQQSL